MFGFRKPSYREKYEDIREKFWKLQERFESVCSLLGIAFDSYDEARYIKTEKDKK